MSAWRRLTQDRHMDSCCFFSRPRWNIFHSCALSHTILPLFVFVCMCVCAFSDFACDGSESSQWKWPSSCIFLSLFLPVCLSVCSCLLILYNRACDGTWAQPMEMTGWGYCLCRVPFFFRNSVFHALVGLWLVHRSSYQGTSIDQVKNLNEALFIFPCFCGRGGAWKSQPELVGPNNRHEVELQCGERQEIVEFILARSCKFVSLGPCWSRTVIFCVVYSQGLV